MAYCSNCGAYVPDGQPVCLACGFDLEAAKKETEKPNAEGNTASQTAGSNEEMRRRLEEQRKRAQEQNRQWAEQEKKRREEQAAREEARRIKQAEARRRAQEEYERRKAEQANYQSQSYYTGTQTGEGNKALATLSYLSILFALPYFFAPQDEYAKFHARQGFKLFLFGIAADILASLIGIGWIATLARLYLMFKGMSNALNGKKEPLPYIGTLGDK